MIKSWNQNFHVYIYDDKTRKKTDIKNYNYLSVSGAHTYEEQHERVARHLFRDSTTGFRQKRQIFRDKHNKGTDVETSPPQDTFLTEYNVVWGSFPILVPDTRTQQKKKEKKEENLFPLHRILGYTSDIVYRT